MMHALVFALTCCTVGGHIRDADGRAVAHASVALDAGTHASTTSDGAGAFALALPAGTYRLRVTAPGFATTVLDDVVVRGGDTIDVALDPLDANRLRLIGRVIVDGRLRVARATVPTRTIERNDLDALGADTILGALANVPSLTMARPSGGTNGPSVVALRGPDPSETRITLDGQTINDTNTGDIDISSLPSSFLRAIDISEGLGPSDAGGANTIGGEINARTLAPTATPQSLVRLSAGSFGTSTFDINATGTHDRLGYAIALSRANQTGYVHDYPALLGTTPITLGSNVERSAALVNLRYAFSDRVSAQVRSVTIDSTRDLSASVNAPLDPTVDAPGSAFTGPGPLTRSQSVRATQVSLTTPLGAGTLTGGFADSRTSLAVTDAAAFDPYTTSYTDRIGTASLQWSRSTDAFDLAIGAYVRGESLDSPDQFTSPQAERSSAVTVRAGFDLSPRVHLDASAIDSRYSTFGTSIDGRVGVRYATGNDGALRFAIGTGFRASLLSERFALPLADLVPDVNCVGANGNPALRPEHATEYELGYGSRIGSDTTGDVVLYRSNLRDAIENSYPLGTTCPVGTTAPIAQVVPINVGNVIYQGGAISLTRRIGAFRATAEYGVNAAYPTSLPASVTNPTSGGNLVVGQQFAAIPLQTFALDLRYGRSGSHAAANFTVKSANNELAQGRYATLDAAVGHVFGGHTDVTLAGTNLTNAVTGRFTRLGLGVPYPTPAGLQATDALVLQPASVRVIVTFR